MKPSCSAAVRNDYVKEAEKIQEAIICCYSPLLDAAAAWKTAEIVVHCFGKVSNVAGQVCFKIVCSKIVGISCLMQQR